MAMNISCKFEKASYNIFFVRAVTVKSLYTLRQRRNEVKSIVSTGCYPVDTITGHDTQNHFKTKKFCCEIPLVYTKPKLKCTVMD